MKFNAIKTKDGLGIWTVTLEGEVWKKFLENAENTSIKNVIVQGFRKGKVPKTIAQKYVDDKTIIDEATRMAVKKGYKFAISQKTDIKPISQIKPTIKEVSNIKCILELQFDIKPELEVQKYTGFNNIKKGNPIVTPEMINAEIKKIKEQFSIFEVKKGKVAKGDHVLIDFVGKIDGKEFPGGKSLNYGLDIGSGQFIPGFETALIGWTVKTKKDVKLNFPNDYHMKDLRSKEVIFNVKLNEIKIKKIPALNAELIDDLKINGVKTVIDLKKFIKNNILETMTTKLMDEFGTKVLEEIADDSNIIVPHSMIISQRKELFKEFEKKVIAQKLTIKEYMKQTSLSLEDINKELTIDAKKIIQNSFILDNIIHKEKINVTKKEIDNEYSKYSKKFNLKADNEQIKQLLPEEKLTSSIKKNKVLKFLFDNNGK